MDMLVPDCPGKTDGFQLPCGNHCQIQPESGAPAHDSSPCFGGVAPNGWLLGTPGSPESDSFHPQILRKSPFFIN